MTSSAAHDSRRQADLYWRQIEQLKAACICIRLTRNRLYRRVKTVEIIKAVASSGAIAGWFATDSYKLAWGAVIAAAQLLDVLKDIFPFTKLHRQAAALTVALETLFIDAEDEWAKIHIGKLGDKAIAERRIRLKRLQLSAETHHFPDGFEADMDIIEMATVEAHTYFWSFYMTEVRR